MMGGLHCGPGILFDPLRYFRAALLHDFSMMTKKGRWRVKMLGVVATAADAMPDTLPDASAATATASNVSGAAGLPMATKNPARIAAATGMQTNFHGLLALVVPLGGDEWLGGDSAMAVSTLQPTAVCHALASEHQPAHSNTPPRPPSQSLTIPSAGARSIGW